MRDLVPTNKFRKDLRRLNKRGYDMSRLDAVVETIRINGNAAPQCRPHKLSGDWDGYWECHIASDWLLIYEVDEQTVTLYRTGTHADLF